METLYPISSHGLNSDWFGQSKSIWTKEENKIFESLLAIYDKETPDRWNNMAELIPGKSVFDVMEQYQELVEDITDIEAGLVPIPGYITRTSSFTLELVNNRGTNLIKKRALMGRSSASMGRSSDHERKKGIPWKEDEHRRFLMGLEKYGKGDWRNISRNFVITKTPTQVASHAQKYYARLKSEGKEKRRPSIHDIRTDNLAKMENKNRSLPFNSIPNTDMAKTSQYWNNVVLDSAQCSPFMTYPYDIVSHGGLKFGVSDRIN